MNLSDSEPPLRLVPFTQTEWDQMEVRLFAEVRMVFYAEWVMDLVEQRRNEILHLANGAQADSALLEATQRVIGERGSINHAAELKDQVREIAKELWYRGEKGDHDHAGIKLKWTAEHAAEWRRGRIREYQFVVEYYALEVLTRLRAATEGSVSVAS